MNRLSNQYIEFQDFTWLDRTEQNTFKNNIIFPLVGGAVLVRALDIVSFVFLGKTLQSHSV